MGTVQHQRFHLIRSIKTGRGGFWERRRTGRARRSEALRAGRRRRTTAAPRRFRRTGVLQQTKVDGRLQREEGGHREKERSGGGFGWRRWQ